jgi:pyrroloquinoline-quinone synthase
MHEANRRAANSGLALNRYYQSRIPMKDAIILSRSESPIPAQLAQTRDGSRGRYPTALRWLKLAEATGLDPTRVEAGREVLPATRYAVNEYLNLVRSRSLLEAVASSLTELFSRDLISLRMEKLREHYPWLSGGLDYFVARLTQAPEDADFAIHYVFEHAQTRAQQDLAIQALRDKCDILWAMLDALYFAYVEPGWPPPGAFRSEDP